MYILIDNNVAGVSMDTGVGASMGLGYQFARDPLTGHYYILPHPHAIAGQFIKLTFK